MSRRIVKWVHDLCNSSAPAPVLSRSIRARRGAAGEAFAARYLEARAHRIIERNFRCRGGEIDLIADDGDSIIFVEVRVRGSEKFGGARASIDYRKRQRIIHAARYYLAGKHTRPCRFDVVVMAGANGKDIEWIRNAFDDDGA